MRKKPEKPLKYGSAGNMRAAVSYGFRTFLNRGTSAWIQLHTAEFIGNPSLSPKVMMYMRSLKRKKVYIR